MAAGIAWWQPWATDVEAASVDRMVFPLPDRPSIAVLPFINMSESKDKEYFADGITEDIITEISKVSGDLGVRYVLGGSVRRAGDKLRITAQLTDALNGLHLWADRYDRDVNDVIAVQSEITGKVVKALVVTLKANEHERLFQKYTTSIDAYDVFVQVRKTVDIPNNDNILRGEELFDRVIALDPKFAGGYAGLAFNLSIQVRIRYSESPSADLSRAFEVKIIAVNERKYRHRPYHNAGIDNTCVTAALSEIICQTAMLRSVHRIVRAELPPRPRSRSRDEDHRAMRLRRLL